MPTLLSINNYFYYRGGAESVFLEQNRLFESAGWDVVPFAMKHPKNLASPWQDYFVDEIEFGENYSLSQKLLRLPKVIYSFEARHKLASLIDKVTPDVCHGHNIYHHLSPAILSLLAQRRVPTLLTLHDLKIACPAYNMLASDGICERCKGGRVHNVVVHKCIKGSTALSAVVMAEAILHRLLGSYSHVNRFIVPSRFYIEKLMQWGMPSQRFTHIPNFVAAARFVPAFEPGERFLYFGRLSREKGIATLLRATARAACALTIVGTGPQLQELQQLAAELNVDVEFAGYLSGERLHDAIRSARAVVLPSEWYENAPMSVLEAYALGKPVIGARIGGVPELIREGETGSLFASADSDALADVLRSYASKNSSQISTMGRNARSWVEKEFSSQAYVARLFAVYRELGVPTEVEPRATGAA